MLSVRSITGIALVLLAISALSHEVVSYASPKRKGAGPLFQIRRGKKWGYMDRTGKIVIPPRFDAEQDFFHGLAAVRIKDKWGFIDEKGKVRISPHFDDALSFLDDLAPVRIGGKWGYVDLSGRMVIEPRFEEADEFHEGLARAYESSINCPRIDIASWDELEVARRFPDFDSLFIGCPEQGYIGFISKTGAFVVPPRFFKAKPFTEGLAAVREAGRDGKWGYIDQRGGFAIPPRFNQGFSFSGGRARVEVSAHVVNNRVVDIAWGFIDKSGRLAIPAQYYQAADFSEGVAAVEVGTGNRGYWVFIDSIGRVVIPGPFPWTPWIGEFSDGLAYVPLPDGNWGYIDHSGTIVLRIDGRQFVDGLTTTGKIGHQIYTDKKGRNVAAYEKGKN